MNLLIIQQEIIMKNDIILFLQYLAYVSNETNYNMIHVLDKIYEICIKQSSYDFQQLRRELSKVLNFTDNFYIKLTKDKPAIEEGLRNWLRRPKTPVDYSVASRFRDMTVEQQAVDAVERVLNELKDYKLTEPDADKLEKLIEGFIKSSLQRADEIRDELGIKPNIIMSDELDKTIDKESLNNFLESDWKAYLSLNDIDYKTRRKIDNLVYRFRLNPKISFRTKLNESEIKLLRVYLRTHNLSYLLDEILSSVGLSVEPKL